MQQIGCSKSPCKHTPLTDLLAVFDDRPSQTRGWNGWNEPNRPPTSPSRQCQCLNSTLEYLGISCCAFGGVLHFPTVPSQSVGPTSLIPVNRQNIPSKISREVFDERRKYQRSAQGLAYFSGRSSLGILSGSMRFDSIISLQLHLNNGRAEGIYEIVRMCRRLKGPALVVSNASHHSIPSEQRQASKQHNAQHESFVSG
jgi:hypothetical protein